MFLGKSLSLPAACGLGYKALRSWSSTMPVSHHDNHGPALESCKQAPSERLPFTNCLGHSVSSEMEQYLNQHLSHVFWMFLSASALLVLFSDSRLGPKRSYSSSSESESHSML